MTKPGAFALATAFLLPALAAADATPPLALAAALRSEAHTSVRSMEGNAQRVQRLLIEARARNAASDAQCLDRVLSRADAALRAGREQARLALSAVDAGDHAEARRQLSLLLGQRDASRKASGDADLCLSHAQEAWIPDQTVVRLVVDPTLPRDQAIFGR